MNRLSTIVTIKSLTPIPEADKIELAKMNENAWQCVVKKGEFNVGDKAIYTMIDSIIDKENPYFAFMESRKYRVWNAAFKGVPAQGLASPISILSYYNIDPNSVNVDDDVTDLIKTTKFERVVPADVGGDAKGGFPYHLINKTDETNLLSYPLSLSALIGQECIVTLKNDGSSSTFTFDGELFNACSRVLTMKDNGKAYPWVLAWKYDLPNKFPAYCREKGINYATQQECIGPKMNGNRLKLPDYQVRVFNVKDLTNNKYLGYDDMCVVCKDLGMPPVEMLQRFMFNPEVHTIEYFQELANSVKYAGDIPAEGIVIRTANPIYFPKLNKDWSFKVVNQFYKQ